MAERKLVNKWAKEAQDIIGDVAYIYVLRDTIGGPRKPCDVICIYRGRAIAIEFKIKSAPVLEHQGIALDSMYVAGAEVVVARIYDKRYKLMYHNRKIDMMITANPILYILQHITS